MRVAVHFYSYFKDLTGCDQTSENLPPGANLGQLFDQLATRFPKLAEMHKSSLMAVGVDYQDRAAWTAKAIRNIAGMGPFSSDRAVQEYARRIWDVRAVG